MKKLKFTGGQIAIADRRRQWSVFQLETNSINSIS
jgi:hypothetical protein